MKTHKDLYVFKESMDLAKIVYKVTSGFPKAEIYGLTSQIRRATVSVPANISEGAGRRNLKENKYFLRISFGSLTEVETLLQLAFELNYLKEADFLLLHEKIKVITVQLSRLMISLDKRIKITYAKNTSPT